MKHKILSVLLVLTLVIGALALVSCSEEDLNNFFGWGPEPSNPPENGCKHEAATVTEQQIADCTNGGKTVFHCPDCGADWTERTAKLGHNYKKVAAKTATCTEGGWLEYQQCTRCSYNTKKDISPKGHNIVNHTAQAADCENAGWDAYEECTRCTYSTYVEIPPLGHDTIHHDGKVPTESESGWEAYDTCSRCSYSTYTKLFATASLDEYHGDYWYNLLGKRTNAEALQDLYDKLEEVATAFHKDTTTDAEVYDAEHGLNTVGTIDFDSFGLSQEEAREVWTFFRADHPLYYWMSNSIVYTSKTIYLLTSPDYAAGADRAAYNAEIYTAIKGFASEIGSETSPYEIAKFFHDKLNDMLTYAYKDDGVTPETENWAHNIIGAFDKGTGVCESYARSFQLLLNAYGVENIFVTGNGGGENHAWNLLKLDDGEWYWCDVTWDDSVTEVMNGAGTEGYAYVYFCVTDDGELVFPSMIVKNDNTFLTKHATTEELPERSATAYTEAAA